MDSTNSQVNVMIDHRLEAYKSFYNHAWAKKMVEITHGTKLEQLTFLLTVNLRAVTNCHTLPWLMVTSMSNLWHGFQKDHQLQEPFIRHCARELPKRMDGKLSRMTLRKLGDEIRDLADKINEALAKEDLELTPEKLWKHYLEMENPEWVAAIWGSQRLVFCGLFFAFEGFVKDVVAIAKGNPDYKGYWLDLITDTKRYFGEDVGKECLEGDFIEISQLARHALAHSSGKETTKLRAKVQHGLDIVDGLVQIQCPDNATLSRGIERRSLLLVEAAVKLPQFQLDSGTGH